MNEQNADHLLSNLDCVIYGNKFVKTKDSRLWILFSDNGQTLDLIPERDWESPDGGYLAEYIISETVTQDEIAVIDSSLTLVKNFKIKDCCDF